MMSFDLIKERFYDDGAFRSISIFETNDKDCLLIGEYLSKYFEVEVTFDKHTTLDKIDEHTTKIMKTLNSYDANINVYGLDFKLILSDENIDLYFNPDIIDNLEKHNIILDLMNEISHLLKKKVYLIDISDEDYILLEIVNIAS